MLNPRITDYCTIKKGKGKRETGKGNWELGIESRTVRPFNPSTYQLSDLNPDPASE